MQNNDSLGSIISSLIAALIIPVILMFALGGLSSMAADADSSSYDSSAAVSESASASNASAGENTNANANVNATTNTSKDGHTQEKADAAAKNRESGTSNGQLGWSTGSYTSSLISSFTSLAMSVMSIIVCISLFLVVWRLAKYLMFNASVSEEHIEEKSESSISSTSSSKATVSEELLGDISLELMFKKDNMPYTLRCAIASLTAVPSTAQDVHIKYKRATRRVTVSWTPFGTTEQHERHFTAILNRDGNYDKTWILALRDAATKATTPIASFEQEGPYLVLASMRIIYDPVRHRTAGGATVKTESTSAKHDDASQMWWCDGKPYVIDDEYAVPAPTMPDVPDYRSSASDIASIIAANTVKDAHIEDPGGMRKLADVYGKHVPLEQRKEMTHRLEKIDSGIARIVERDSGKDVEKMLIEWLDSAGTLMQSYVSAARYKVDGDDKKQAEKVMREVSGALDSLIAALDKVLADTWSKDAARASLEAAMLSALVEAYGASPLDIDVVGRDGNEMGDAEKAA